MRGIEDVRAGEQDRVVAKLCQFSRIGVIGSGTRLLPK